MPLTPKSDDYRLYLEEKFAGLTTLVNAQFSAQHLRQDSQEKSLKELNDRTLKIQDQTTKTNSRVTHLEKFKEVGEEVIKMRVTREELKSVCEEVKQCKDKIEGIDDNILEYKFFKKYPKTAIILILATILFVVFSVWSSVDYKKDSKSIFKQMNQIEESISNYENNS